MMDLWSARIFSSPSFPTASSTGAVRSSASADTTSLISSVVRHYGRCYWELSKARLSMLVVATSGTGFVLGSGNYIDVAGLCCTCAGTMMVAASANSLNQVFERENDVKMKRTALRPLISIFHAATWATTVGVTGTSLLAWNANSLASGLAASNFVLYAFVYTPWKQIHPINTWVGAVVGAIPPLLRWAAASGEISLNSMILPAALYFWQIPHFMALAYLCCDDYAAGGFRMISSKDVSSHKTAMVSLRNCLYLLPLGYIAYEFCNGNKDSLHVAYDHDRATILENNGEHNDHKRDRAMRVSLDERICRPPVAYASVAPFPFLPAPLYIPQDA